MGLLCKLFGHKFFEVKPLHTGRDLMVARLKAAPEMVEMYECRRCGKRVTGGTFAISGTTRSVDQSEALELLMQSRRQPEMRRET